MAKQMHNLFEIQDANGRTIDFERFTQKRATTCVNQMIKLYRDWWSLYREKLNNAAIVLVYETPNGYDKGEIKFICTAGEFKGMIREYDSKQLYQNL